MGLDGVESGNVLPMFPLTNLLAKSNARRIQIIQEIDALRRQYDLPRADNPPHLSDLEKLLATIKDNVKRFPEIPSPKVPAPVTLHCSNSRQREILRGLRVLNISRKPKVGR